ncbi:MAG: DUF3090 family protein [Acidimicrobiales bacterium]|nr:DUF3090 family protein [Acidimicrobiales bacterium]
MSESFDLGRPSRFTAGAVGEPGGRTFFLQAFAAEREVCLKCEKQQAQALATHLVGLLADLPGAPDEAPATEALPPAELAWAVGSISIGVDRDAGLVLVVCEEMVEPPAEGEAPAEPATARLLLTPEQVRGFAAQVDVLLAASRPLCRLCEHPIDPSGHACPRLN